MSLLLQIGTRALHERDDQLLATRRVGTARVMVLCLSVWPNWIKTWLSCVQSRFCSPWNLRKWLFPWCGLLLMSTRDRRQRHHNVGILEFWQDNSSPWLYLVYLLRWQAGTEFDLSKNNPNKTQWRNCRAERGKLMAFYDLGLWKEILHSNTNNLFATVMIFFFFAVTCLSFIFLPKFRFLSGLRSKTTCFCGQIWKSK